MDFTITSLGKCQYDLPHINKFNLKEGSFISDDQRIFYDPSIDNCDKTHSFELAGPRRKIYFDPQKVRSGIVTCGGLCPGLNDVIRSIVMESYFRYESKSVVGFRYGYNGLNPANKYEPVELDPWKVKDIHTRGGTILGSSRGGSDDIGLLVDTLEKMKINILYCIGGDGTLRGAHEIARTAIQRGLDLAVVGIPKTIDNDINYIQKSFGFETAFSVAVESIAAAHTEAEGAPNGIGLVKLMGRNSGFIAANAALAMNDVNFVLIPEVPFDLEGDNGFLTHLENRLHYRDHAVICVAEGAGQEFLQDGKEERDASHNLKLKDIGLFLKEKINDFFKRKGIKINLKYIDPSYIIRSAPAVPNDSLYCLLLGQYAVHAGMAGKTDVIIGRWNNYYTHVPITLTISERKAIDPDSLFWATVVEATGQPISMKN